MDIVVREYRRRNDACSALLRPLANTNRIIIYVIYESLDRDNFILFRALDPPFFQEFSACNNMDFLFVENGDPPDVVHSGDLDCREI